MTIKAVVFDFDGTLMDTETYAYEAFSSVYTEHGHELKLEDWALGIGTHGGFDPYTDLEERLGRTIDRDVVEARYNELHEEKLIHTTPRPGVIARLEEARSLGWAIGLASSSPHAWIEKYLQKLGIREYFSVIRSADDVEKVKPDPALYLLAAEALGVRPEEAIAIEDSMNGLRAAVAAGMYAIVTPNPVTKHMDFTGAKLIVNSLEEIRFADLKDEEN
ncbi:MAG: HAD-IA family hydrolase [Candidatus Cohnella colombiensis]|uniref:HAD-IA family hydrolase n=1 Tax=Candidatus Cohnella colombiensis TaxID=3121368 RepID=A0AA95F2Q4_9BACL|nr:MAG: HAD-IA family hydrolase [Cohnella sp.]